MSFSSINIKNALDHCKCMMKFKICFINPKAYVIRPNFVIPPHMQDAPLYNLQQSPGQIVRGKKQPECTVSITQCTVSNLQSNNPPRATHYSFLQALQTHITADLGGFGVLHFPAHLRTLQMKLSSILVTLGNLHVQALNALHYSTIEYIWLPQRCKNYMLEKLDNQKHILIVVV